MVIRTTEENKTRKGIYGVWVCERRLCCNFKFRSKESSNLVGDI